MPKKGTISTPEVHAEISQKQITSISEVYVCMCHTAPDVAAGMLQKQTISV
jgi:hypothetical protein